MAAILVSLVVRHGTEGVFIAGFLSGLILLAAAFLKVGALVSYIPSPVVTGFTSGIAVIIALGQIDNFFGTSSSGEGALAKLFSYTSLGFPIDLATLGYGLFVVLLMILWPKKWNARFPASLLGIIITLVVQMLVDLPVKEVGMIPRSLMGENRLHIFALPISELSQYISPAISIAALGMVESLLCGSSAGKMKGEKLNATRELYAQGIGNVIIPSSAVFPLRRHRPYLGCDQERTADPPDRHHPCDRPARFDVPALSVHEQDSPGFLGRGVDGNRLENE
jgi:SulP family sulfate permease